MKNPTIIGLTPFEKPDVNLISKLHQAGAFPVLSLGYDKTIAQQSLDELADYGLNEFGVCVNTVDFDGIKLPRQTTLIIVPFGMKTNFSSSIKVIYQVCDVESAKKASKLGAAGIIVKGNEAAGAVGYESSFILFQRAIKEIKNIPIWVQGGVGLHTSAALLALGAAGVVLDSQLALFPESTLPKEFKDLCNKLSGTETKVIDNFRVLIRPNSPSLPEEANFNDLKKYFQGLDITKNYIAMGQDITLAVDLVSRYKKLSNLIFAFNEAANGHLNQAKSINIIKPGNTLAQDLNITYPIAQGPMTRVSDVPIFAQKITENGALSFVALSLLKGKAAQNLINDTKKLAGNQTWGVGILGFAPQELRDEQMQYIMEAKPPVVLIAGGRPSQAKPLEKIGIKTFLHVPSVSLLDMFLKEGARRFVFEGRECGGHVGPLSSMVLWEKQIDRLLKEDQPELLSIFFAGGIHDSLSTAFISVMVAPLAAKGVKIGVLMGTAYLYTQEAVSTGAIQQKFQDQALIAKDTVLLETAPGHETRCLDTTFASFFNTEKSKLQQAGLDKKIIWEKLEA